MLTPYTKTYLGEPLSLGSDCCEADVENIDGVIICCSCDEPCEEVFETHENMIERLQQEESDREEMEQEYRWERNSDD